MQRQQSAKLHFNDKFEQLAVDARMRQRIQQPYSAAVFFRELQGSQRRRQLVIFDAKLHRLAAVDASPITPCFSICRVER
jgi:hypothetical protein